jgi:hypothetical protein
VGTISDIDALREQLAGMLREGLETDWQERAYTSEAVNALVLRLQALDAGDHAGKLKVAGFTLLPYEVPDGDISQSCDTCIYYVPHRRFCALPELRLPVEAEWSCTLWRV